MIRKAYFNFIEQGNLLADLQNGNLTVFTSIYTKLYPLVSYLTFRRVKDELAATCIAQDAFLMIWLLHKSMTSCDKLAGVLKGQVNDGCANFYSKSIWYSRNTVKLDDINNYQQFMCGYTPEEEYNEATMLRDKYAQIEAEKMRQWKEVTGVIPCLSDRQQLFVKLCLKHSFNYEAIAKKLGGISAYRVSKEVDTTLEQLKKLLVNSKKLNLQNNRTSMLFEGVLTEEQTQIMRMRYEMNLCFGEISKKLKLPQGYVQKTFINACMEAKKVKRI